MVPSIQWGALLATVTICKTSNSAAIYVPRPTESTSTFDTKPPVTISGAAAAVAAMTKADPSATKSLAIFSIKTLKLDPYEKKIMIFITVSRSKKAKASRQLGQCPKPRMHATSIRNAGEIEKQELRKYKKARVEESVQSS
ncbi:hypothetical protein PIB30_043377 [Stylosanthes scabra]|uniref:Uncharacterized protein n=1 Tax=Stylosanthes scabra TaxID=79078 RepID=A0ABU6YFU8_9FABA|nr:hypothetical protein [Stylosanthes scabra]